MKARFDLRARDWLGAPERKLRYNELHFAEAAPRYDVATRAMSLFRDASWKARLVDSLPEIPSPLCVDLGCGTGDVAVLLGERYPQGRIVGVDISEPMLRIARRRKRRGNVRFLQQDMCATDFPDGSVEIVTGSYALRNAPDLCRAVGEIRRIMRPGGTAAFLDFSRPRAPWVQARRYALLRNWCGFWGLVLHGSREVHGYIAESLKDFPDREGLCGLFAEHGFDLAASTPFFFGITELLAFRLRSAPTPAGCTPPRRR